MPTTTQYEKALAEGAEGAAVVVADADGDGDAAMAQAALEPPGPEPELFLKDHARCNPLHLAILSGALGCLGGGWGARERRGGRGADHVKCMDGIPRDQAAVTLSSTRTARHGATGSHHAPASSPHHPPRCAVCLATPLAGSAACVRLLLRAGCSTSAGCDGCPPLIMAVCTATHAHKAAAALQIVEVLLQSGADPFCRWVCAQPTEGVC